MCITPSYIWVERGPGYEQIPVPCKKCWRCNSNRVSDYVGRALCEASTSDWTATLTLTYRPRDDLADKVLTPHHFQTFIRSFRDSHRKRKERWGNNRPFSLRYFAVGEYGSAKGRAHFHAILFGNGEPPEIPHQRNTHIDAWPHGHVYADFNADDKALRYVMKYVLKNEKGKFWFSLSKKPPLGSEYFRQRAERYVDLGVFPQSFEYLPPGGQQGKKYLLTGASRRDFLANIWRQVMNHPKERLDEWVLKASDKVAKWELEQSYRQHLKQLRLEGYDLTKIDLSAFLDSLEKVSPDAAAQQNFKNFVKAPYEAEKLFDKLHDKPLKWVSDDKGNWSIDWSATNEQETVQRTSPTSPEHPYRGEDW